MIGKILQLIGGAVVLYCAMMGVLYLVCHWVR